MRVRPTFQVVAARNTLSYSDVNDTLICIYMFPNYVHSSLTQGKDRSKQFKHG